MLDQITDDLNWREVELGALKILLKRRDLSEIQKSALLRASWALLYAHYEGFVKVALTIFYEQAARMSNNCGELPINTRVFALDSFLKNIRSLPPVDCIAALENFVNVEYQKKPLFPDVDTKSNLWPNVLEDLLVDADITLKTITNERSKIKTLVQRRNDIAHGKNALISEVDYYLSFESVVYDLMYELALCIEQRLARSPYR